MYICVCKAITDGKIRQAACDPKIHSWKELVRDTHVATQCGTCAAEAKATYDTAVQAAAAVSASGACTDSK